MNWRYPNPYIHAICVSSEHIDGLGHSNNTQYIQWCEEAAWAHSAALGMSLEMYQTLGRAMAVVRSEFDYLKATYEGDELLVGTWLTDISKRLTMERRFEVRKQFDGTLVCQGVWQFVCIRLDTGAPARMPSEFEAVYAPAVVGVPC